MARKEQPKPEKAISDRSSKAEILAAYEDLKGKPEQPEAGLFSAPAADKPAPLKKVAELSLDAIVGDVAGLKLHLTRALGEVEQRLGEQWQRLESLRQAVADSEARLQELHGLDTAAVSLSALQTRQKEEKEAFDAVVAETRQAWEKERHDHEAAVKERDAQEKKERAREEDEYQYQLKVKRQREKDAFANEQEARRAAFEEETRAKESELASREAAVASREEELAELRKKVATFPDELQGAVAKAAGAARQETEARLKLDKLLLEKDMEKERELQKLNLASLQDKTADQEARLKALDKDLKEALAQSQAVATRAIEGIAGIRHPAPAAEASPREAAPENRR